MKPELGHHISPSGTVISEMSLLPSLVKAKLEVYNQDTSTFLQRPDFSLLTEGICAFSGEEKPPVYSGTHPKDALIEKMVWAYDPAPYILGRPFSSNALALLFIRVCPGYFAVGTDVTLAAISSLSDLTGLVKFNLSFRRQRIKMVVHLIKLCSIIQALQIIIRTRDFVEEFAPIVGPSAHL
jgi:hypothetical protein